MVEYSTMAVTAMIMLIFMNVFMIYTLQMPGGQDGETMNLGFTQKQQDDLNANTTSFLGQAVNIGSSLASYTTQIKVDSQQQNYLNLFINMLFGIPALVLGTASEVIGIVGVLISAMLNIFVGYIIWIDYLLPANTQLVIFGWMFKGFFFYITLYGLYVVVSTMFGMGTGAKA